MGTQFRGVGLSRLPHPAPGLSLQTGAHSATPSVPPFPWALVFSTLPERVSWLRTCVLWKKLLPGGWGGDWLGTQRTLDGRGHVSPHSCASPGPPSDLPGTHFPSGQMNSWTRWTPQILLVLSSCTFRSTLTCPSLETALFSLRSILEGAGGDIWGQEVLNDRRKRPESVLHGQKVGEGGDTRPPKSICCQRLPL